MAEGIEPLQIPDGAKQPQDHKPKHDADKPKVEKTDTGYRVKHRGIEVVIDADALNDFELLRDLAKWQDPAQPDSVKVSLIPSIFERFFGPEQQGTLLNALRDKETKRVRLEVASSFLFEVFQALNPES